MIYFKDTEFRNKAMLHPELLANIDKFRGDLGSPITITADYAVDGHVSNSWHYKGMAIDGTTEAPLWQFIALAMKYFNGIGIYLDCDHRIKYFHLDIRDTEPTMWVGYVNVDKVIDYIYKVGP